MATLEDRLTLAAFNAATEGRGNTKLVWGTYTGTGEYGIDHPNTLTFDGFPLHIRVWTDATETPAQMDVRHGILRVELSISSTNSVQLLTWDAQSVSWYTPNLTDGKHQLNRDGKTYYYLALLGV